MRGVVIVTMGGLTACGPDPVEVCQEYREAWNACTEAIFEPDEAEGLLLPADTCDGVDEVRPKAAKALVDSWECQIEAIEAGSCEDEQAYAETMIGVALCGVR